MYDLGPLIEGLLVEWTAEEMTPAAGGSNSSADNSNAADSQPRPNGAF